MVCIGDVADVFDGPHATPKKLENGPYFLSISSLNRGALDLSQSAHLSEEDFKKWTKRVTPESGDILFSYETRLGEAAIMPPGIRACLGRRMGLLRPDRTKVLPEYLLYAYLSPDFQGTIEQRKTHGATVDRIALKELPSFPIRVPDIAEQQLVVDNLKALDAKIQLNQQINQTLEQMAQAIFKSWFVDFEPVKAKIAALEAGGNEEDALLAAMLAISGKTQEDLTRLQAEQPEQYAELRATAELFPSAMQDSELGGIPEGWSALPLYDTAEYVNGAAFKAKDFSESGSGLPIIKIAELKQGISAGTKYTNAEVKDKYRITDGSVLYSWSGSPETSLEVFKWFGGEGWLNQHIFKLNFTKGQSEHFTYFLLKQMKPLLVRTAQQKQTTGLGHITVADMKRIKIPYPSPELLSAFSENIEPLYSRSSNTVRESKTLADLRDTLLPKLLSGELSATGAEPHTLEAVEIANV